MSGQKLEMPADRIRLHLSHILAAHVVGPNRPQSSPLLHMVFRPQILLTSSGPDDICKPVHADDHEQDVNDTRDTMFDVSVYTGRKR